MILGATEEHFWNIFLSKMRFIMNPHSIFTKLSNLSISDRNNSHIEVRTKSRSTADTLKMIKHKNGSIGHEIHDATWTKGTTVLKRHIYNGNYIFYIVIEICVGHIISYNLYVTYTYVLRVFWVSNSDA